MTTTNSTESTYRVRYFAGAPRHAGTTLPANVTGDCDHDHRTPEAAQACIEATDRAIKRGHGPNAYCDRIVMMQEIRREGGRRIVLSGTTEVWDG